VQVAPPHAVTDSTTLPGDIVDWDNASVSPDGQRIIVSVSEAKSDVWLMENLGSSLRH
jgi:hypothetical protein